MQVTVDVVAHALRATSQQRAGVHQHERALSAYTICDSGATCCATSWVLSAVGNPVPA